MVKIREAKDKDQESIYSIISQAFEGEGNFRDGEVIQSLLFKELIKDGHDVVSLVAEDSKIIGHVLVSPVSLEPDNGLVCGQVSPLSVHPNFQSKGIGRSLMYAVITKGEEKGLDVLFLLGDPNYYKLFGFLPIETSVVCSEYVNESTIVSLSLESKIIDSPPFFNFLLT